MSKAPLVKPKTICAEGKAPQPLPRAMGSPLSKGGGLFRSRQFDLMELEAAQRGE